MGLWLPGQVRRNVRPFAFEERTFFHLITLRLVGSGTTSSHLRLLLARLAKAQAALHLLRVLHAIAVGCDKQVLHTVEIEIL